MNMAEEDWYRPISENEVVIHLKVIPGASKNEVVGPYDGMLKVKLCAPPVDGKANKELIKYLSKITHSSRGDFKILSGLKSKTKKIQCKSSVVPFISDCFA